jgi:hypothetical protein
MLIAYDRHYEGDEKHRDRRAGPCSFQNLDGFAVGVIDGLLLFIRSAPTLVSNNATFGLPPRCVLN